MFVWLWEELLMQVWGVLIIPEEVDDFGHGMCICYKWMSQNDIWIQLGLIYINRERNGHNRLFIYQKSFFANTCYFWSWYSALVIHMFLKEGKLARILPPYQHIVSLLAGANTRVFTSLGSPRFNSFTNLSGKPSKRVFPPDRTI